MILFNTSGSFGTAISGTNITVEVPGSIDPVNVIATFTTSPGATARVDDIEQVSGVTSNDFTSPVTYTVLAQDGETSTDYTVEMVGISTGVADDHNNGFRIHPNPSTGLFHIENKAYTTIEIFQTNCRLVLYRDSLRSGVNSIDVSGLPVG